MCREFRGLTFPAGTAIWLFAVLPLYYGGMIGMIPTWAPVLTAVAATCAATIAYRAFAVARENLDTIAKNQRETTAKNTGLSKTISRAAWERKSYDDEVGLWKSASKRIRPSRSSELRWKSLSNSLTIFFGQPEATILEGYSPAFWRPNLLLHAKTITKAYLRDNQRFRREDYPVYSPAIQALIDETVRTP